MSSDLPALWHDFIEVETALNEALTQDTVDGLLPDDDPRVRRFYDAQEAIVSARPADLPGLHIQLAYYRWLTKDSDPNAAQEAMFSHVVDQLETLAARQAA